MVIECKINTRRNLPLKKRDTHGINAMDRLNMNVVKKQFQVVTAAISTAKYIGKYTGRVARKLKFVAGLLLFSMFSILAVDIPIPPPRIRRQGHACFDDYASNIIGGFFTKR